MVTFINIVKLLIDSGTDVNSKASVSDDSHGRFFHIVKVLLEAGADVNLWASDCETALLKASATGNQEIVTLLLEAGAEVNGYSIEDF